MREGDMKFSPKIVQDQPEGAYCEMFSPPIAAGSSRVFNIGF